MIGEQGPETRRRCRVTMLLSGQCYGLDGAANGGSARGSDQREIGGMAQWPDGPTRAGGGRTLTGLRPAVKQKHASWCREARNCTGCGPHLADISAGLGNSLRQPARKKSCMAGMLVIAVAA